MNIIQKQPNPSGAYPPIQSWQGEVPPDGYYQITADISEFFNGFIIPTVKDGKAVSFICNEKAWEAWKASLPAPTPKVDPPTTADMAEMLLDLETRTSLLEMGVKK